MLLVSTPVFAGCTVGWCPTTRLPSTPWPDTLCPGANVAADWLARRRFGQLQTDDGEAAYACLVCKAWCGNTRAQVGYHTKNFKARGRAPGVHVPCPAPDADPDASQSTSDNVDAPSSRSVRALVMAWPPVPMPETMFPSTVRVLHASLNLGKCYPESPHNRPRPACSAQ